MVLNEKLNCDTSAFTLHSTGLVITLYLKKYRRRLENVYIYVAIKFKSVMIFYLVMIKLGFCLFTKKGKERSCNIQGYVYIVGGAVGP